MIEPRCNKAYTHGNVLFQRFDIIKTQISKHYQILREPFHSGVIATGIIHYGIIVFCQRVVGHYNGAYCRELTYRKVFSRGLTFDEYLSVFLTDGYGPVTLIRTYVNPLKLKFTWFGQ